MIVKRLSVTGRFVIARGLMLALVLCGLAGASQAGDLYEVQVPVAGQQDRERTRALRVAFEQMLLKVTGSREAAQAEAVVAALRQPMGYVQQYRYLPLPDDDRAEALREDGYLEMLRVSFDDDAVNQLLQDAGVPLWGRTRPVTLMLLAVEERGERWLLGGDASRDRREAVEGAAATRGLPVLLPLMDLEDRRELHFTDVWGNFPDALLRASARYRPGAVLTGRLLQGRGGDWTARWSLYQDGNADHWTAGAGSWVAVVATGVDGAADRIAARHARIAGADGGDYVDIVVTDVRDIGGYERTMRYLRGLDPVDRLQVTRLEPDRISFRLTLSEDRDSLVRLIGFGSALVPVPVGPGRVTVPPDHEGRQELTYRLLP